MATPHVPPASTLESSIDLLYQGPLDQFTTARNALAAARRKGGDKPGAERVKALAKPSVTAWAVNQVWWRHRALFEAMLEAGAAQRAAHVAWSQGRTSDVRDAGEARRRAVQEVTDAVLAMLGGKKAVAPDLQYRIAGTVEALASSGVPEGEHAGRLTRDLQSSGLDVLGALAASAPMPRPTIVARGTRRTGGTASERESPPAAPVARPVAVGSGAGVARETARERKTREAAEAATRARDAAVARARADVEALEAVLSEAVRAAEAASDHEVGAQSTFEVANRRRVQLEAALDDARTAEAAARRDASTAVAAASRAELDRARASRDLARARETLARLEGGSA